MPAVPAGQSLSRHQPLRQSGSGQNREGWGGLPAWRIDAPRKGPDEVKLKYTNHANMLPAASFHTSSLP